MDARDVGAQGLVKIVDGSPVWFPALQTGVQAMAAGTFQLSLETWVCTTGTRTLVIGGPLATIPVQTVNDKDGQDDHEGP